MNSHAYISYMHICMSKNIYIKKRWQEYTEELYKKDLHNQDNHDGVVTPLDQASWNVKSSGP